VSRSIACLCGISSLPKAAPSPARADANRFFSFPVRQDHRLVDLSACAAMKLGQWFGPVNCLSFFRSSSR